jgi:hypothetical protein
VGSRFGRTRRSDAPLPSGDPLAGLLEDMHDLRLMLAADLTAAAGAAEAGAEQVARDIVEADQQELARFARVANVQLERLARHGRPEPVAATPTWRRRVAVALPIAPVVGAMALSAAAATGILPLPGTHSAPNGAAVRADDRSPVTSFQQLVSVLNSDPSAAQVIAAASKLHRQLSRLIETTSNDPSRAAEVTQLLQAEQSLLMREQPPGASIVLDATRKLAARLVTVAQASPSAAPTLVPSAPPHSQRPTHHTVKPAPTPSATPSSAQPSSGPSSNPDASPSPSGTPFPTIPQ